MARRGKFFNIFNEANANAIGASNVNMNEFEEIGITISTTGFSGTINCLGSQAQVEPDMTQARNKDNAFEEVAMFHYLDRSTVGKDELVLTADTNVRQFIVNQSTLRFINFELKSVTAGTVTIEAYAILNQD